jgi:hypothetical protein
MEGLECKNWGEMWMTGTIFRRWELAVADQVHIRIESSSKQYWCADLQYLSVYGLWFEHHIGGVISVIASSVVDRGIEYQSYQAKDY